MFARSRLAVLAPVLALLAGSLAAAPTPTTLEYLGELSLLPGTMFEGDPIGGLSGLVWDDDAQLFVALSDDRGERGAPRYYRLRLDLDRIGAGPGRGVTVVDRVRLGGVDGAGYKVGEIDPEGIALAPGGDLFLSTEGVTRDGIAPFVARLDGRGREVARYPLPDRVAPDRAGKRGVRDNLGLESLTVTPDGSWLIAGLENALVVDGPAADVGVDSPSRLFGWRLGEGGAAREYRYAVGPVTQTLPKPDAFRVNGLVDLVAFGDDRLWALEREFVAGAGMALRLYDVRLSPALGAPVAGGVGLAEKRLVADFADLGISLDNFEGMTLGPRLADGRRAFVVVSDDNFNPFLQATRFLVFAADFAPPSIAAIQGAGHRSPLENRWAVDVEGVVTAVDAGARPPALFVESTEADDDPATSEGLRVEWADAKSYQPGDRVRLNGRIVERLPGARQLTVTTLAATAVEATARGVELPPAPIVGRELRVPPTIDDDGLADFEPSRDAIDFWESLEGMRVVADGRLVTGPASGYGELVLALDDAAGDATSRAGGYLLTPAGPRQDRVIVSGRLSGGLPPLAVGSRLSRPPEGVVDYGFSNYKLLATRPVEAASVSTACDVRTSIWPEPGTLRVASLNVENLSVADGGDRFERLGEAIVTRLGAPDVVALQEVQDDSGKTGGDQVVSARGTLDRLTAAVAAAGGPRYQWTQIDPELDREGGIPGGNIRVALLFDPARVALPARGAAGPLDAVRAERRGGRLAFEPNPARVAPASEAFTLTSGEGVRRSLAVELTVDGAPWFFAVNHWSSKYEDGRAYGAVQPPPQPTGAKRQAQAEVVRAFALELLASDPEVRLVVLGDFNDLPWSAPIRTLSEAPLVNLTERVPAASRYSYNFEGSAQLIDHVVVTPAAARGARAEIVHLNSDCPDARRTSDHDAVVVGLVTTAR